MAKVYGENDKQLILLNEDELEPGKLYFMTSFTPTHLYKNIPTICLRDCNDGKQRFVIKDFTDYYRESDPIDFNAYQIYDNERTSHGLSPKEPFMVLQKEKKYAKFTCVQIVQGDLVVWIVQEYPSLKRPEFCGYYDATKWPNSAVVERMFHGLLDKQYKERLAEVQVSKENEIFYLKKFLKEKVDHEKIKKKNAPVFASLREKYSTKPKT